MNLLPLLVAGRVLTLDEAVLAADAHQPQIRAARAQVLVGQARLGEARSVLLPRLDFAGQYQRSTANFTLSPAFVVFAGGRPIVNNLSDTVGFVTFGLTASETVYDFGRTGGAIDQARAAAQGSRADLETTAQGVLLGVRVAYFNVLAAKELVWVGEESVKNQAKHVQQVQQFVSAGTRPKIDLRSAELNLANAELALVRVKNGLDLAKVALNEAMGAEGPIDYDVAVPPENAIADENGTIDALMQEATRARPELVKAEMQVRQQEGARRLARSGYLPALVASAALNGTQVADLDPGMNWYVGLGLSWNLFAGGLTREQTAEAEANLSSATALQDLLRQQIRADLEAQLLAVAQAKESLHTSDRAVATAEERLKLAEGRYQAGAGDILELDDAQVAYSNAKAQRVGTQYDLATARARLARALGRK